MYQRRAKEKAEDHRKLKQWHRLHRSLLLTTSLRSMLLVQLLENQVEKRYKARTQLVESFQLVPNRLMSKQRNLLLQQEFTLVEILTSRTICRQLLEFFSKKERTMLIKVPHIWKKESAPLEFSSSTQRKSTWANLVLYQISFIGDNCNPEKLKVQNEKFVQVENT